MTRQARIIATALAAVLFAGCTSWHQTATPAEAIARAKSGEIRVDRVDGSTVRLVNASIVGDSLIGISPVTGSRIAIPTTAVASTETKQVSAGRTAALGGVVVLGAVALAGILVVALVLGTSWN